MKILQLIPNISGGGAERLVVDLSNELAKSHKVTLLTLYDPRDDDLFRDQIAPDVKTLSLGKKSGFDWKITPKLYKAIKKIAPNVIHNHLRSFNYLMPFISFLGDIPIIHTVHNDAFKECPNNKIRYFRKQFFKRNNIMPVTISKESADSFEKTYSNIGHNLIANGRRYPEKSEHYDEVNTKIEGYRQNGNTKIFINIGRLIPQKNQLVLVEAFNKLVYADNANAVLLIIGGGRNTGESRQIQQQLQQAEQENAHICLLGERPNATDYLHAADYFCLSSLYEGMPITLIEAFATATIPVCTPVGGIPEMVAELDSSLLSKKVDVGSYYETLKRAYWLSKERQGALQQQAKQLFEAKYSIKHCVDSYVDVYKELLS